MANLGGETLRIENVNLTRETAMEITGETPGRVGNWMTSGGFRVDDPRPRRWSFRRIMDLAALSRLVDAGLPVDVAVSLVNTEAPGEAAIDGKETLRFTVRGGVAHEAAHDPEGIAIELPIMAMLTKLHAPYRGALAAEAATPAGAEYMGRAWDRFVAERTFK